MSLLKGLTVFIGWLSGSVAGIAALLYACGYLVTRAHLNLLGVDELLVSSNERVMQQGAHFFAVTGELLIKKLLGFLELGLLLAIPAVVLYLVASRFRPAWTTRIGDGWRTSRAKLAGLHQRLPWSADVSVFVVLLLVLYTYLASYLPDFLPPLMVSDLLYQNADTPPPGSRAQQQLLCWLLTANAPRLRNRFSALLDGELVAIVLVLLVWRITIDRKQRLLMVTPFLAVFALYTTYLPMLYGVLVRPMSYNVLTLPDGDPRNDRQAGAPLFLLQKTNDEFVVWDSASRRVLWIARGEVRRATIGQSRALFKQEGRCGD
jgi:hypothetical protein